MNFKDLHANTALHLAAQNGQIGVTEHLVEAGADLNAPNAHKHIPLHLGKISHKMNPKFHQKFDIFHEKISTASDFGSYLASNFKF